MNAPLFPTAETETTQPQMQVDTNTLIMQWSAANATLAAAKVAEMKLRKQLEACSLFDQKKEKGSQRHDLGKGYILKLNRKQSTKVENGEGEAFAVQQQLRNLGGLAIERAENIFKFTPSVSSKVYNAMTDEEKAIVDTIVTTKQASPSLELIEPDKPKE